VKVWFDDRRPRPDESWVWLRTPDELIETLKTGGVEQLSLDHDLGLVADGRESTGYDVLLWIEEQVATQGFDPPSLITVHSANVGRPENGRAIEAIYRSREE
jgi:hypothetical protein